MLPNESIVPQRQMQAILRVKDGEIIQEIPSQVVRVDRTQVQQNIDQMKKQIAIIQTNIDKLQGLLDMQDEQLKSVPIQTQEEEKIEE